MVVGWLFIIVIGLALVFIGFVWWHSPGTTAPIVDQDGQPVLNSIAALEAVGINGSTQWLLIRGRDQTKPVLLFLHGGPGLPELALLSGHDLEKDFVVVNWEQRGSAKSYEAGKLDQSFTVDTFVEDAAEVSRWLIRRFNQPKIFLMAHSWGTFLGVLTVKKYPELFRAFFSIGQIARQLEAEQISYDWVLQQARERNAGRLVRRLEKQGRPPYRPEAWLDYLTWQREVVARYRGGMYRANFFPLFIRSILLCREYTLADKVRYALGAQKSVRLLWPQVVAMDLLDAASELQVPYYLFQGVHDYQTPYSVARRYFDQLRAPRKQLVTFLQSAHSPIFEEPDLFLSAVHEAMQRERKGLIAKQ